MSKQRNPKGMGSYRKLPNGTCQWRQKKDGEERTLTAKTPAELQEKIKKIADLPIIKNKYKVSYWFEKWLEVDIKSLKKAATYNQYNTLWEKHIKPIIGNRTILSIKSIDIQNVISKMNTAVAQEAKYDDNGKLIKEQQIGFSTWTMKHTRKVMHIAFEKAVDDKIIPENPVKKIEIPKKQAKPRKTFTTEELAKLFIQLSTSRWIWAVRFMLVTGLRRGELLALKWSNVDFKNQKLVIIESDSSTGLGDTKNSKEHYVPLSELAIAYLNNQKNMLHNEDNPILYNDDLRKSDLVFPTENGTMMRPDSFNNVIVRAAEKVNIHASPHMFRHTFVYMSKGLMTLKELQETLGHDESTSTLDIYGTMLSDTQKVANKIDEAFKNLDEELYNINKKQEQQDNVKLAKVIPFRNVKNA